MSKSVKLTGNNYIDTTGIVHNKRLVSDILDRVAGTSGGTYVSDLNDTSEIANYTTGIYIITRDTANNPFAKMINPYGTLQVIRDGQYAQQIAFTNDGHVKVAIRSIVFDTGVANFADWIYLNDENGVTAYEEYSITSMGSQNITLSQELSSYTYYEVLASRYANGGNWITTGKIPIGKGAFLMSAEGNDYFRDINCPGSGNQISVSVQEGMEQRCVPRIVKLYK